MNLSRIIFLFIILSITGCFEIKPYNNLKDCNEQCKGSKKSKACIEFCNCIHQHGGSLDSCLDAYNNTPEDSIR